MGSLAGPKGKKQRVRKVTCRFHCDCGRHFSSEEAFSLHRQGSYSEKTRHCVAPEDVEQLVAKSEDARCEIGYAEPVRGVTVWWTRAAAAAGEWGS